MTALSPATHPPHAHPSAWIERFASLVAPRSRVLDLACGHGRHARLFAERGHRVVAIDRDASALAALAGVAGVETRSIDLEAGVPVLEAETFDAIVVVNYLHRPLFPQLLQALSPEGVLLYETFAQGNEAHGRPRNPDFLLTPHELLDLVRGTLTVVAFEQGHVVEGGADAVIQRLAAIGMGRPWPPALPLR